jgi:hypothetical protein
MKCQRDQGTIQETDLSEWTKLEISLLKMISKSLMPKVPKINLEEDKLILTKETLISPSEENPPRIIKRETSIKSLQMETVKMEDDNIL